MKRILFTLLICLGVVARTAPAEDRLTVTANGSSLRSDDSALFDSDDGKGGSIGWLHNFSPDALLGVGVEHQRIADAQWTYGSLRAALTRGDSNKRRSLYGEFNKGSGDDDAHDFTYQTATVGVALPVAGRLSMQLEDKQVDIDTTHGNLPKLGVTMTWTPRLQTNLAYAHSLGGNLNTRLGSTRLDYYGKAAHLLMGAAVGRANPVVLNLGVDTQLPGFTSREGFVGLSKSFSRTEWLLLASYLKIADIERVTLTLSYTIHLNTAAAPK